MLCIFWISGCTSSGLNQDEYIRYFKENGLIQSETQIGNIKVAMKLLPAEYMLLTEGTEKNITQKMVDEKSELLYVHLDFSDVNSKSEAIRSAASNENELYQKIEYASFKAQEDVFLIQGKDTASCVLYHFERAYNLASYNKMILAFPNKRKTDEDITLRYEDKIFGIGIINLIIGKDELNNIPKLKI